jgi:N-acetylneuraminate synthase
LFGEAALGEVRYELTEQETAARVFRRSLFVVADMRAGETFTTDNVRSIRPGHGLAPKYLSEVVGQKAAMDIKKGTPLSLRLVSPVYRFREQPFPGKY